MQKTDPAGPHCNEPPETRTLRKGVEGGGWGQGDGESVSNGDRVSDLQAEKVQQIDGLDENPSYDHGATCQGA